MKERSQPRETVDLDREQKLRDQIDALYESYGLDEMCGILPEDKPEYETLKGKKIVMVEDVPQAITNYLPGYIVATDGNAAGVCHTDQNLEQLAEEIMSQSPDIILMDYTLANGITGVAVMEQLKRLGYSGKFVGCSSEARRNDEFSRAGAIGSVPKNASKQSDSIKYIAELVKNS